MKYAVVEARIKGDDEFIELVTENKEEAVEAARSLWATLCKADKKNNRVEVRECVNEYDYNTVEW